MKKIFLLSLTFIIMFIAITMSLTNNAEARRKGFYCNFAHPALDCFENAVGCSCETVIVTP